MFGLRKDLKQFLISLDIYLVSKLKKKLGVYLGGSGNPLKIGLFRGLPDPLGRSLTLFTIFATRYVYRDLKNCFKIFLCPNTKISQPFYNIDCYSVQEL